MPQAGFEPSIAVFERAKTVDALDSAATVMGDLIYFTKTRSEDVRRFGEGYLCSTVVVNS
jgi:hypothetical protein